MKTLAKKPPPVQHTVLSAGETVEHSAILQLLPEGTDYGAVEIGEKTYLVRASGDTWTFQQLASTGGARYTVEDRGGASFSCTCRDFIHRSEGGRKKCKHLNCLLLLKAALLEMEVAHGE